MTTIHHDREPWRKRLELPNYKVREAARYAGVHPQTVTRWQQSTAIGDRKAKLSLSYLQLVELAMVAAWRQAGMKLSDIRAARAYFAGAFNTTHPFATLKLKSDGLDLAHLAGADALVIGNRGGQMAWTAIIGERFREFEYDGDVVARWRVAGPSSPIIIDPQVRFGAPHVAGVPTWVIYERHSAGESVEDLAEDFSIPETDVLEALKFECTADRTSRH